MPQTVITQDDLESPTHAAPKTISAADIEGGGPTPISNKDIDTSSYPAGTDAYKAKTAQYAAKGKGADSTLGSRTMAAGEGLYEGGASLLHGLVDNARMVASYLTETDPAKKNQMVIDNLKALPGGMWGMIKTAPKAYLKALQDGDYDEASKQASLILTQTVPALGAVGEPIEGAMRKGAGYVNSRMEYAQDKPWLVKTPQGSLRVSLRAPNLNDERLGIAGNDLKEGEELIKKPVKDVDSAAESARAMFEQMLMPARRAIIDPQANVQVKTSAQDLFNAKKSALDKLKTTLTAKEYMQYLKEAKDTTPNDLTIGELERMNTNLNASNSSYHRAKLSSALTKEQNVRAAMDIAAEPVTRDLMERGMQTQGKGNYQGLKDINNRIGALLNLEDSIHEATPSARVQGASSRLDSLLGRTRIMEGESGVSARTLIRPNTNINEGIANAMRRWTDRNPPINTSLRSSNIQPATIAGKQQPAMGLPQNITLGKKIKPTQQGQLFTQGQTSEPAIAAQRAVNIPEGSELTYKSRGLDGRQLWHYKTPAGDVITSDKELDLDAGGKVRADQITNPTKPKEQPPAPPKRKSKGGLKL